MADRAAHEWAWKQEFANPFRPLDASNENLVAQIFPRWNRMADWLREAERFSMAA
jgi:hypothetical protein